MKKAGTAQTAGRQIRFEYGWNVTNVIDAQNRIVTYQFNNAGQAVSIRNPEGEAVFMAYNSADRTKTQLAAVSKTQTTVFNLLKNHGFDKKNPNDYWTKSSTSAVFTQTHAHTGYRSVKLPSGTYIEQSVSVNAGAVYTASAYFTGAAGGVVQVLNGSTVIAQSDPAQTFGTTGSDWTRGVAVFTVPAGVSSIKIRIAQPQSASGTAYADSVQLETGETPNRYNMLQNSDFTDGASSSDDSDNSTLFLQSRYYNPEVGRFISSDVLLSTGQGVLGHNAYAYCLNNPVNMSDETGMWPSWAKKIVAAVAVVAVVATVAAITVATAGAGTAAAVIAVGAAIGMASGAAMGAATGALSHRVSTGSWNGAGTAALNGMGNRALSGAVTGAITGAAGSASLE